jgi:hypothetical protein
MKNQLSINDLQQLMKYDAETGVLTWLHRSPIMFVSTIRSNTWNTRFAGKSAFTNISHGYYQGSIHGIKYQAHRVAWALYYGKWPDGEIDHINGIGTDNRIQNLREVTRADNCRNQKLHKGNMSGYSGIRWYPDMQRYRVQIGVSGTQTHLGVFVNLDDAIAARIAAERLHDYHANHGKR